MSDKIEVPSVFKSVVIVRKNDEKGEANMPNNLFEAMVVFYRTNSFTSADACKQSVSKYFDVLAAGPDGKTKVNIGHGALCWSCGHVGVPTNFSSLNMEDVENFLPICSKCGDSSANIVLCMQPDGSSLPWIDITTETEENKISK